MALFRSDTHHVSVVRRTALLVARLIVKLQVWEGPVGFTADNGHVECVCDIVTSDWNGVILWPRLSFLHVFTEIHVADSAATFELKSQEISLQWFQ